MALDKVVIQQFWLDLQDVTGIVCDKLTHGEPAQLRQLPIDVKERCASQVLPRTMSFARQLLDEMGQTPIGYNYPDQDKLPTWFTAYMGSGVHPIENAANHRLRVEEVLMEQLTAVWLMLYFLSVPLGHPWERARRIADEQGGYPAGACMTKLIGDVYRQSRLEQHDAGAAVAPAKPAPRKDADHVLVLTRHPSVLLMDLLKRSDTNKLTPDALHQLGRCYALFQLRLYVAEGWPMRYIVTLPTLRRSWDLLPDLPPIADPAAATLIASWLARIFPRAGSSDQRVELYHGNEDFELPPCALGRRTGVYALDNGADDIRFVGNWVNDRLLNSYRSRLTQARAEDAVQLLGMSASSLASTLKELCASRK